MSEAQRSILSCQWNPGGFAPVMESTKPRTAGASSRRLGKIIANSDWKRLLSFGWVLTGWCRCEAEVARVEVDQCLRV